MKQTNHTPGPWAIGFESDDEQAQIISVDGNHLATVSQYPLAENAALIAAAPDLLAALKEAVFWVDSDAQKMMALQAIKRAEGSE